MKRVLNTGCTIEVEHTEERLFAAVELDEGGALEPGDSVLVHGERIVVPFGERIRIRRMATVTRATSWQRWWTKLAARFDLTELYEVSFSPGRAGAPLKPQESVQ
ncbi:MAG: hypothetical protein GC206_02285 [Alphaproteobacteria bacterium]|nr:hypothetical protein [Alphaproteobacteria bacterium]